MNNIRQQLLIEIISPSGVYPCKYTDALKRLKAVITLEREEKGSSKMNENLFKLFEEIEKKSNSLTEDLKGIPLMILEQYFLLNSNKLDVYLNIEYHNICPKKEYYVKDLYLILEEYFNEMYMLAIRITDLYSIEIKLKTNNEHNVF